MQSKPEVWGAVRGDGAWKRHITAYAGWKYWILKGKGIIIEQTESGHSPGED